MRITFDHFDRTVPEQVPDRRQRYPLETSHAAHVIVVRRAGHRVTRRLVEQGLLEKVYMTKPEQPGELFARSNPTWPMFIVGVSLT